jgi:DNA-binding transcriptional LysR family regulator
VHSESFVRVVPASHGLAKRKRVRLRELAGEDFVGIERASAPAFHDLIFGNLRDAGIVPNVSQSAAEIPTLISLIASDMGVSILPASAVKLSVASVVACEILDRIPMCEVGIAVSKRFRADVVDNFRSFALNKVRSLKEPLTRRTRL